MSGGGEAEEGLLRVRGPEAGTAKEDLGRRNLSKMAITRNMEMRIAVATNPKETALTELSKCLHLSSPPPDLSSRFRSGDMVGVGVGVGVVPPLMLSLLIPQFLLLTLLLEL